MRDPKVSDFGDELDALVDKHAERPMDDRPTYAEIVGALTMKAWLMMAQAQDQRQEDDE